MLVQQHDNHDDEDDEDDDNDDDDDDDDDADDFTMHYTCLSSGITDASTAW